MTNMKRRAINLFRRINSGRRSDAHACRLTTTALLTAYWDGRRHAAVEVVDDAIRNGCLDLSAKDDRRHAILKAYYRAVKR